MKERLSLDPKPVRRPSAALPVGEAMPLIAGAKGGRQPLQFLSECHLLLLNQGTGLNLEARAIRATATDEDRTLPC